MKILLYLLNIITMYLMIITFFNDLNKNTFFKLLHYVTSQRNLKDLIKDFTMDNKFE